MQQDRIIGIGEAAREFGVAIDTLRRWARDGKVRCWRAPSGRRLFDREELQAFVQPREDAKRAHPEEQKA